METMLECLRAILALPDRVRAWLASRTQGPLGLTLKVVLSALGGVIAAAAILSFAVELFLFVAVAPGTALVAASVGGMVGALRHTGMTGQVNASLVPFAQWGGAEPC